MAGWVTPARRAARVTLRSSNSASNATSRFRFTPLIFMQSISYISNISSTRAARRAHVGEASTVARPNKKAKIMLSEAVSPSAAATPLPRNHRRRARRPPAKLAPARRRRNPRPAALRQRSPARRPQPAARRLQRSRPARSAEQGRRDRRLLRQRHLPELRHRRAQAAALGYRNVRVFGGGKAAWKDAGLPLVTS